MGEEAAGYLIMWLPIGVLVAVAVVSRRAQGTPKDQSLEVGVSPKEAIDVVSAHMAQEGFAIAFKGETAATFTRPKKANTDIGCLLLLLGIVPGLLYFGLFRGTQTTTVTATTERGRTRLILSGDDWRAQRDLAAWIRVASQ